MVEWEKPTSTAVLWLLHMHGVPQLSSDCCNALNDFSFLYLGWSKILDSCLLIVFGTQNLRSEYIFLNSQPVTLLTYFLLLKYLQVAEFSYIIHMLTYYKISYNITYMYIYFQTSFKTIKSSPPLVIEFGYIAWLVLNLTSSCIYVFFWDRISL